MAAALPSSNPACSSSSPRLHRFRTKIPFSLSLICRNKLHVSLRSNCSSPSTLAQDGALPFKTAADDKAPSTILDGGLLSVTHPKEHNELIPLDVNADKSTLSITVVGASGDLAKKKIFPALFALYYEDCLPEE